jgi:hypothetical protein
MRRDVARGDRAVSRQQACQNGGVDDVATPVSTAERAII